MMAAELGLNGGGRRRWVAGRAIKIIEKKTGSLAFPPFYFLPGQNLVLYEVAEVAS